MLCCVANGDANSIHVYQQICRHNAHRQEQRRKLNIKHLGLHHAWSGQIWRYHEEQWQVDSGLLQAIGGLRFLLFLSQTWPSQMHLQGYFATVGEDGKTGIRLWKKQGDLRERLPHILEIFIHSTTEDTFRLSVSSWAVCWSWRCIPTSLSSPSCLLPRLHHSCEADRHLGSTRPRIIAKVSYEVRLRQSVIRGWMAGESSGQWGE